MIAVLWLSVIVIISAACGERLLKLTGYHFNSLLEKYVFSISLGLAVISYLTLGIGLIGGLYRLVILMVLCGLAIISYRELIGFILSLYQKIVGLIIHRKSYLTILNRIGWVLLSILILQISLNLIGSLAPPSASDALTYHLAVPKIYTQNHRIEYLPQIWFSNLPFTIEMLYLLGMLIHSDILANLVHWIYGILIVLGIISFCNRHFNLKFGLLAATIFYTAIIVVFESTSAFIDLGLTLYGLLAVHGFIIWHKNNTDQIRWLILSALYAGIAGGTKYLGLIPICVITGMLMINHKLQIKRLLINTVVFLFISLAVTSPWLIKSWVYTGNPVYPFFFEQLGGKDWNINSATLLSDSLRNRGMGYNIKDFILAPWNVTLHGEAFELGEAIGPLFLSFLPFLIFYWRKNNIIKHLFLYLMLYFPFWFYLSQQGKFLLPMLPVSSIIVAYLIVRIAQSDRWLKTVTISVLSVYFLFSCCVCIIFNSQFIPPVFGLQSHDEFLAIKTKYYNDLIYINQHLPQDSKILVWVRDRYYLDHNYVPAHPTEQGLIDYSKYHTAENLLSRLKQIGITHIMKPGPTTPEHIKSVHWAEKPLYKLQYELEHSYLKPIYKKQTQFVHHRTLLRKPQTIDVYIYEIDYQTASDHKNKKGWSVREQHN